TGFGGLTLEPVEALLDLVDLLLEGRVVPGRLRRAWDLRARDFRARACWVRHLGTSALVEPLLDRQRGVAAGGAGDERRELLAGVLGAGAVEDDGVVGVAAPRHGDVGVAAAGGLVEDGDADVDGVAL